MALNLVKTNMKFTDYLPNPTRHSMFLEPVTPLLITNTTAKLKPNLVPDNPIIVPITVIINKSFRTGVVPPSDENSKSCPNS